MTRRNTAGNATAPATPQPVPSALPPVYTPRVAAYAGGPFLDPVTVTPTHMSWRNARTYLVETADGNTYRAIRIHAPRWVLIGTRTEKRGTVFVGWWAVEMLGTPLLPAEWGNDG